MIEEAKKIIAEWCEKEYESVPEFEADGTVQILYSTDGDDDEHTVEVFVNIVRRTFDYYYDEVLVASLLCMNDADFLEDLRNMDWQEEYGICVREGKEDAE